MSTDKDEKAVFRPVKVIKAKWGEGKDPTWVSCKFNLSQERATKFRKVQVEMKLRENQLMRQMVEWAIDHLEE